MIDKLKEMLKVYKTQGELANAIGVSKETVNRWLNGKNKPTMEVVINRINELYREVVK